ncbi:MAG: hypothetical protein IT233_07645, partial [Bacteroidia bacterium]|nr:hypothetical protein [Bacteroidia bacterium]
MKKRLLFMGLLMAVKFVAASSPFNGPASGNFLLRTNPLSTEVRFENFDVVSGRQFLQLQETADSINARLQWVYEHYGIECYFVFMEYFDVHIAHSADGKMSADSLFGGGKWYSEHSVIDSLRTIQKKTGAWMKSALSDMLGRPVILVSMARYHAVFSGAGAANYYLTLHYAHRPASLPTPPFFNEVHTGYLERCRVRNQYGADLFNDNLALAYAELFRETAVKVNLRSRIPDTYTSEGLSGIFRYFTPGGPDYKILTLQERLHCLSVFAGEEMSGGGQYQPKEEEFVIRILSHTPAEQLQSLFTALAQPSVMNADPRYPGDRSDQTPLLERLISRTDGDNYALLMRSLTDRLQQMPGFSEQLTRLLTEEEIGRRHFIWNERWLLTPEIGQLQYMVNLTGNGKVKVSTGRVSQVQVNSPVNSNLPTYYVSYNSEPPVELEYFEPVLFTSQCELPAFAEGGAENGLPMVVPAVFLKYAYDKQFNHDMLRMGGVAGDLVTLVSAPLAFFKAVTWTRRAWIAFEVANATGNLLVNTLGADLPPGFEDIVQQSNYLMIAVGGKNILKGGYQSLSFALAGTKEFTSRVSKELALTLARSLNAESAPGLTRLQKLQELSATSLSAKAITRFYEKLKTLYKDSFKRDLEADLLPPLPTGLPSWVSEIKTVEDYL